MTLGRFNTTVIQTLPAIVAFAFLYTLLAAEPLMLDVLPVFSEPRLLPEIINDSASRMETTNTSQNADALDLLPFYNDSGYGYIGSKGEVSFMSKRQGSIALTDSMIVRRQNSQTPIEVISPFGRVEAQFQKSGLPFTSNGRAFIFRADLSGLCEVDQTGNIVWEKEFSTILTAFFVTGQFVAAGRLDGIIEILDKSGNPRFIIDPDMEADDPITGLAMDEANSSLIVTEGTVVQSITLILLGDGTYKHILSRKLSSVQLQETACSFTPESGIALIERENYLAILNLSKNEEKLLPTNGLSSRLFRVIGVNGLLKGHSFFAGTPGKFWLGTVSVYGRLLSMIPVIGELPSVLELKSGLGFSTGQYVFVMNWEER